MEVVLSPKKVRKVGKNGHSITNNITNSLANITNSLTNSITYILVNPSKSGNIRNIPSNSSNIPSRIIRQDSQYLSQESRRNR